MDKEVFLYQLESSLANSDKRLFAKTIYDLPVDVIVGFTKEELSRIMYISHQFSSQKMYKLFNYLENQGSFSLKNALKGIDELDNSLLSKFYYSLCISLFENDQEKVKRLFVNNAAACGKLAEIGVDSRENLENTVSLCVKARQICPKKSTEYALALMSEGNARQILAEMGIDSKENLVNAVSLYIKSKELFHKTSGDYARALVNEGNARQTLAEMGVDSRENLENAVSLYGDARKIFPKTSEDYACALVNEGHARNTLADIGVDSRENLENAVSFYIKSKELFHKTSRNYAIVLLNEGNARKVLAEIGIDSRENLENAISLYGDAKRIFDKTTRDYARALVNEGNARQTLAEMGVDSRKNFENAVSLYGDARKIFLKTSRDYARTLVNEGNARARLAEIGVNGRENLEIAVHLYEDAKEIFQKTSSDYARTLINEGNARSRLSEMGIYSRENFEKSKELYLKSVSILDKLGDGWKYSIALLNLNSLLKENFYKTGDKKNLEEWEENLGDIEEKIKDRDITYKERVMARIHEIRASLFEFDGKSGINKASREYNKAYELSKDLFYQFMDEFCQARIDTLSFCQLVSYWKETGKESIFLDYYDYAVFECHLENALKSTINEEDELKLAVEKLKEIRERTQIKIIKDRVSAYIHLLQALVDCFNNGSYKEAAENVKEGCKIFREYDDKQGQQMCEIFHNAVVKRENPDAWQEIIRNREFSSNFYSLLCEYSDRKRANLEFCRSDQVHEMLGAVSNDIEQLKDISMRTENKVDEIKNDMEDIKEKIDYIVISLKPGIREEVEISVGSEYLGTGAKHIITISLQDISYSELKEDIEKIAGNRINKLSDIPAMLANKIKTCLIRHGKENILEKLA